MAIGNSSRDAADEQARRDAIRDAAQQLQEAELHIPKPPEPLAPNQEDEVQAAGFGACGFMLEL